MLTQHNTMMNREQTEGMEILATSTRLYPHNVYSVKVVCSVLQFLSLTFPLDLKAFEQRLIECVDFARTCTRKWMSELHSNMHSHERYAWLSSFICAVLLLAVLVWFAVSIVVWWSDDTEYVRACAIWYYLYT